MNIKCNWCGKDLHRPPCKIKRHNFCCRQHLAAFSSKSQNPQGYLTLKDYTGMQQNMKRLNAVFNPQRMDFNARTKLRLAHLGKGNGKTYSKLFGAPEHRAAAERMLGRRLRPGEVVHHINGDKRDNRLENLQVFSSQAEHARWHAQHKEVMSK